MQPIIYINDTRFPGPAVYPPPGFITGIPSQDELDAYPRMFTWGELKEIVRMSSLSSSHPLSFRPLSRLLKW